MKTLCIIDIKTNQVVYSQQVDSSELDKATFALLEKVTLNGQLIPAGTYKVEVR